MINSESPICDNEIRCPSLGSVFLFTSAYVRSTLSDLSMSDDDSDSPDESATMFCEGAATDAVDHVLESADSDEVQGVVIVPDSTGDHRMAHCCRVLISHEAARVTSPVMACKLRLEYPGAIYRVMNRGDRREPILRDHADCQRFVETMLAQKQPRKLSGERAYRLPSCCPTGSGGRIRP